MKLAGQEGKDEGDGVMPDDTDHLDEETELAEWRIRELKRLKRDKEER
jgi:hypothetical protein